MIISRKIVVLLGLFLLDAAVFAVPVLNFTSPTPPTGFNQSSTSVVVNLSLVEPSLNSFVLNWNGTNTSFYDPSLVLAWNFDNITAIGDTSTKITDISAYGNNGTAYSLDNGNVSGGWTNNGKYGGAIRLNGTSGTVMTASGVFSPQLFTVNFTVSAWLYPLDLNNTISAVAIGFPSVGGFAGGWRLQRIGTEQMLGLQVFNSSGGYINTRTPMVYGTWIHLLGIRSGDNITLYKNGLFASSSYLGNSSNLTINLSQIKLGVNPWNGSIDEVRIWNRALSPSEIWMQYQSNFQKYNATNYGFYSNLTGLVDSVYSFQAYANGTSGNLSTTELRSLNVDLTVPSISLDSPQNQTYVGTNVTLAFSVFDRTGVSSCKYELNGAPNVTLSFCVNTTFLALVGNNTLTLWVNDTVSNQNAAAVSFSVSAWAAPSGSPGAVSASWFDLLFPLVMALIVFRMVLF